MVHKHTKRKKKDFSKLRELGKPQSIFFLIPIFFYSKSLCLTDFLHHHSITHPLHQTFGLFRLAQTQMFVPKCNIHQRLMGLTGVRRFNNPKKVCGLIQRWQGVGSRDWWRRSRQQAAEVLDDTCLTWGFKSRLLEDVSRLHPEKDGSWALQAGPDPANKPQTKSIQ